MCYSATLHTFHEESSLKAILSEVMSLPVNPVASPWQGIIQTSFRCSCSSYSLETMSLELPLLVSAGSLNLAPPTGPRLLHDRGGSSLTATRRDQAGKSLEGSARQTAPTAVTYGATVAVENVVIRLKIARRVLWLREGGFIRVIPLTDRWFFSILQTPLGGPQWVLGALDFRDLPDLLRRHDAVNIRTTSIEGLRSPAKWTL